MRGLKKGLLDTNILVHASASESEDHKNARVFVASLLSQGKLCLTPQVMIEFFNVMVQLGMSPAKLVSMVDVYRGNENVEWIYPGEMTFVRALRLAKRYNIRAKRKIFDVFLAVTAMDNKVGVIYTQNVKDFKKLRGVRVVDPLE